MSFEDFGYSDYLEDEGKKIVVHYWITPKKYCYKEVWINDKQHYKGRCREGEYLAAWDRVNNY